MPIATRTRLSGLALLLSCTLGIPARAGSASVDVTAGRGSVAWSLLGDVDLVRDQTFLLLGYSAVRPREGSPLHQLTAGVDLGLGTHWRVSALADAGLPTTTVTPLLQLREVVEMRLRTTGASAGLVLRTAYDSAGLSDLEWGIDAGVGTSAHRMERTLLAVRRTLLGPRHLTAGPTGESLLQVRPSLGAHLLLRLDTELSLRGSYVFYSRDPLSLGQLTAAQLDAILASEEQQENGWDRLFRTEEREQAAFQLARRNLAGADATDGMLTAPLLFDVRLGVTHRFSGLVRGQVGYAFNRYFPAQGSAHVLSTRWTLRFSDSWRAWAGASVQVDVYEDAPPEPAGLLTLGGEFSY